MELVSIAASQICIMFIIMVLAFLCYKLKIVGENANKVLSDVLLHLINPILIFVSYQTDFRQEMLLGLGAAFLMAILSHILFLILARLLIPKSEKQDYLVERSSLIYTNCGFFGIPLVNGIFGSEGVVYLTAYVTVFNLLIWTHCVSTFKNQTDVRSVLKVLKSPTILAIIIGLPMLIFQIHIPGLLLSSLEMLKEMNTPMAMLVAGISLAQTDLKKIFLKPRLYLVCFLRMLALPLLAMVMLKLLFGSGMVCEILVIAGACPVATMVTMFALEHKRDYKYSSEIFAFTNVLAVLTIPLVIFLFELWQYPGIFPIL